MACRDRHTSKVNAPREINIKKRVSERKGSIKQTNQTMNILTLVTSKIPGHANVARSRSSQINQQLFLFHLVD